MYRKQRYGLTQRFKYNGFALGNILGNNLSFFPAGTNIVNWRIFSKLFFCKKWIVKGKEYWKGFFSVLVLTIYVESCLNKTQGLQLRIVSESKINPLINPVNTRGTCKDKNYYYNIWVQGGYISNFISIAPILTEVLAEKIN